jgi:hypothetical protein
VYQGLHATSFVDTFFGRLANIVLPLDEDRERFLHLATSSDIEPLFRTKVKKIRWAEPGSRLDVVAMRVIISQICLIQ